MPWSFRLLSIELFELLRSCIAYCLVGAGVGERLHNVSLIVSA